MTSGRPGVGADLRVPRRATALLADRRDTRPLQEWRDVDAYVLLGDPGAGKSESMRAEALASAGVYLSARDFIALGVESVSAGKTLFIDGLDEMRAGSADGRVPLDAIRSRLNGLGRPRFRLSCREHDWRAQTDRAARGQQSPNANRPRSSVNEQPIILKKVAQQMRDMTILRSMQTGDPNRPELTQTKSEPAQGSSSENAARANAGKIDRDAKVNYWRFESLKMQLWAKTSEPTVKD